MEIQTKTTELGKATTLAPGHGAGAALPHCSLNELVQVWKLAV